MGSDASYVHCCKPQVFLPATIELLLAVPHKFKVHLFCSFTVTQIQPSIVAITFLIIMSTAYTCKAIQPIYYW